MFASQVGCSGPGVAANTDVRTDICTIGALTADVHISNNAGIMGGSLLLTPVHSLMACVSYVLLGSAIRNRSDASHVSHCLRLHADRFIHLRCVVPHISSSSFLPPPLIQGHANMLKALLQHLDSIPDEVVVGMSVPRATPMVYELDHDMKPIRSPNPATLLSANILSIDGSSTPMQDAQKEVNAF